MILQILILPNEENDGNITLVEMSQPPCATKARSSGVSGVMPSLRHTSANARASIAFMPKDDSHAGKTGSLVAAGSRGVPAPAAGGVVSSVVAMPRGPGDVPNADDVASHGESSSPAATARERRGVGSGEGARGGAGKAKRAGPSPLPPGRPSAWSARRRLALPGRSSPGPRSGSIHAARTPQVGAGATEISAAGVSGQLRRQRRQWQRHWPSGCQPAAGSGQWQQRQRQCPNGCQPAAGNR